MTGLDPEDLNLVAGLEALPLCDAEAKGRQRTHAT
jgi:hypothetical protein